MKNIYLIPTDKPSRLVIDTIENKLYLQPILHEKTVNVLTQNIYITNDEEIKQGDYVCASGGFRFVKTLNKDKAKTFKDDGIVSKQNPSSSCHLSNYKKIILTTDQDLIKDGVQAIDDEFLEWFVKNPSCERVEVERLDTFKKTNEVYVDEIAGGNYYEIIKQYKIIIPQEEHKQEILEEHNISVKEALLLMRKAPITFVPNKKMYSEEEFLEFSEWVSHNDWVYLPSKGYWVNEEQEELEQKLSSKEILNLWFEQFKKK